MRKMFCPALIAAAACLRDRSVGDGCRVGYEMAPFPGSQSGPEPN